ncbi:MAG TPA: HAD family hydrolase [Chloroflexota bacterium]
MSELAFLFDVDNTLLDNDRVKVDLERRSEGFVGLAHDARFWELYEEVRRERDYVDFPETLRRYRAAFPDDPKFPYLADLVLCYPYDEAVYPGALEALARLHAFGRLAIVSDGDPVFQPAKIARAGLAAAVDDNVWIYAHKEEHIDEVLARLPAERHVLVDDKKRILQAVKTRLGARIVTVHVRQGKYAAASLETPYRPDLDLASIADLARLGPEDFRLR